jgi:hypothetical protein
VIDFFPLTVEFEERLYAAGIIKGSRWIKREGRPTEDAVLTGRMIDRTIRPLFNSDSRKDTQVVLTVLSHDGENENEDMEDDDDEYEEGSGGDEDDAEEDDEESEPEEQIIVRRKKKPVSVPVVHQGQDDYSQLVKLSAVEQLQKRLENERIRMSLLSIAPNYRF